MKLRTRILKIVAGIAALSIVALLLMVYAAFHGDPISALLATRDIRAYAALTYSGMPLAVQSARYNFKFGSYMALADLPGSEDTHFAITWEHGEIVYDSYETDVLGGFNTFARVTRAMEEEMERLASTEYPHRIELLIVSMGENKEDFSMLELDMAPNLYDPPMPLSLTIWLEEEPGYTYRTAADRLIELKALTDKRGIPVEMFSLSIRELSAEGEKPNYESMLYAYDISSEMIKDEDALAERIEQKQRGMDAQEKE